MIIISLLLLVVLLVHHYVRKDRLFLSKRIPCETSFPLVGSLLAALREGVLRHDMSAIRKYGSVHGSFLGIIPNLVIAKPEFIKEILVTQFENFQQRIHVLYISDWWDNSVVMSSGHHWRYMRSVITPAFNSTKVRDMFRQMSYCLREMDSFLHEKFVHLRSIEMDMRPFFSAMTLDVLCNTSFGHNTSTLRNSDSDFTRHAKILSTLNIESNALNGLPMVIPGMKHVFKWLDLDYVNKNSLQFIKDKLTTMINDRKTINATEYTNDTLQNLIDANNNTCDLREYMELPGAKEYCVRKKMGLNDDELVANAIVVLMAGYDTTATTLTWMAYLLATNPHVQEKLVQAIDGIPDDEHDDFDAIMRLEYLDWFLSETLRLFPAANRTGRDATVDTTVCGVNIYEGMSLTIPIYAIHRMPEYWERPNECIPERFAPENKHRIIPYTYLPFGAGPRACLGVKMAQMLCKVIMVNFLKNYTFAVSTKTEADPVLETSLLTKPLNGVVLNIVRRD